MSVIRIASRYAKSLLDLAIEKGILERVVEDIKGLQATATDREMLLMLKSPIINTTKKKQIFEALFNGKFDEMTMTFLNIVLTKKREMHLPEIADEFIAQYQKHKELSKVKVISAVQLNESALSKIKEKLVASSVTEKNVAIETSVDPSLMGGFIVQIGDKQYNASVAHKLELLRKELTSGTYNN